MGLEVVGYRCAIRYVVVASNRRTVLSREPLTCQDPIGRSAPRRARDYSAKPLCWAIGDAGFHGCRHLKHPVTGGPPATVIVSLSTTRGSWRLGALDLCALKTGHSDRSGGRQSALLA